MFILKRFFIRSINSCVRLYSFGAKNHYDVLKLRRNCTDKEIKEAFIKLSKEYHPDKNKDARAQEHFVKIVEAYNVLGKASTRAQYDVLHRAVQNTSYVYRPHVPYNLRKNPQYTYYYDAQPGQGTNTQAPKKEKTKSYYGVSGVTKKLPNSTIIMMCFGFALVGLIIQMVVIRQSFRVHRDTVNERSKLLSEELERVRSAADENGNELQTRLLLEKIVNGANPTVATASLGQALAGEKKGPLHEILTEYGVSEAKPDWNYQSKNKMTGKPFGMNFDSWFE